MRFPAAILIALCALTGARAQDVSNAPMIAPAMAAPPASPPSGYPGDVRAEAVPGTTDCDAGYPPASKRFHEKGWVYVGVDVAADGTVGQVVIERSSGNPRVDAVAAECMRHWRFTPQVSYGQPVASHHVFAVGIAPPGEQPPMTNAPTMVQAGPAPPPPPVAMPVIVPAKAVGRTHDCATYYPLLAKQLFEAGQVLLGYDVGADGVIANVSVVKSSGSPRLDAATLACVREKWRDTPALQGGTPVPSPGHQASVVFSIAAPSEAADFVTRGTARQSIGDHAGAIADFTTAIGLDPKDAAAYKARAHSYAVQGDRARAAADLRKAKERRAAH